MKKLLTLLTLLLAGCASAPPRVVTVVQKVEVPISVRCEYPYIEPPILYFSKATKKTTTFRAVQLLAAENKSLDIYSKKLAAALIGCSKDPSGTK